MPTASAPPIRIAPSSGCSQPAISRSVVVLPQPEGPSKERNSPLRTRRLTESTAVRAPNRLVTARSSTSQASPLPAEVTPNVHLTKRSLVGTVGQRRHQVHEPVDRAFSQRAGEPRPSLDPGLELHLVAGDRVLVPGQAVAGNARRGHVARPDLQRPREHRIGPALPLPPVRR